MTDLVVASNRGPVQFEVDDDGNLSSGRGAGGMVTALGPALAGQAGTWVAAAITEGDRVAARRVARSGRLGTVELAQGQVRLRSLVFDPREYQSYYNRVANRTIWFLHHYLFDVPRHPRFDRSFRVAWQHYEAVNQAFATACDDEAGHGGGVFVQDYHLALVPAMLRQRRPDLRIAHFSHCPWADPGYFLMLPGRVAGAILEGMLGADLLGFLVPRWASGSTSSGTPCGPATGARCGYAPTPSGSTATPSGSGPPSPTPAPRTGWWPSWPGGGA
jgi:trehalose 6-phosphate synthase